MVVINVVGCQLGDCIGGCLFIVLVFQIDMEQWVVIIDVFFDLGIFEICNLCVEVFGIVVDFECFKLDGKLFCVCKLLLWCS